MRAAVLAVGVSMLSLTTEPFAQPSSPEPPGRSRERGRFGVSRPRVEQGAAVTEAPPKPLPAPQRPPADATLEQRTKLMGAALDKLNDENDSNGVFRIVVGTIYFGFAAVVGFSPPDGDTSGSSRTLAATGLGVIGGSMLGVGIGQAIYSPADRERWERFMRERKQGKIDAHTLAGYEGEIRADAASSRFMRHVAGWANLGLAASGPLLIAMGAAAPDLGTGRGLAYFAGGALLLGGSLDAIIAFSGESASEREWRLYQERTAKPAARKSSLQITPMAGPNLAALGASGEF